jgi:hypothetical protein
MQNKKSTILYTFLGLFMALTFSTGFAADYPVPGGNDLKQLSVSPATTQGTYNLSFKLPSKKKEAEIRIVDGKGKTVYLGNWSPDGSKVFEETIKLKGKTSGTYTLNVVQGKKYMMEKIELR